MNVISINEEESNSRAILVTDRSMEKLILEDRWKTEN